MAHRALACALSLLPLSTAPALATGSTGTPAAPGSPAVQLEGWNFAGSQPGARVGTSLATADVNGDGFGDLVVGAPGASIGASREGRVFVFLGSSGGLAAFPDWTVRGWQAGANLGASVARAGDVNGDGFDDVVVAAPGWDRHAGAPKVFATGALDPHERYTTDEGAFLVFHGSPTGLGLVPARVVVGIERGERVGSALAGVGDVNGDGFDDVVVGATGKTGGRGGVFLFSGSASGTKALPDWIRVGTAVGTGYGSVVAAAGDVNGDGFADFVAGQPTGTPCGKLQLFHGSLAGPPASPSASFDESRVLPVAAADFDQTGLPELLYARASSCNGGGASQLVWRRPGAAQSGSLSTFGPVRAVAAGDVNGDGWTDWMASVPSFSNGPFHGRVHVYLNRGGSSTFAPLGGYPHYEGDEAGAEFGAALAAIDVDGDGADELFIAAPEAGDAEGEVVLQPGWHVETSFAQTHAFPGESALFGADFDQDGRDDLVSLAFDQPRVRYGTSTGPSAAHQTLAMPALASHNEFLAQPSTGDANGDGYPDLLLAHNAHFWGHGGRLVDLTQHTLWLGSASGLSASFALNVPGGGFSEACFAGDVNGDGMDDVLVLQDTGDQLRLGTAAGTGLTEPVQTLPVIWPLYSDRLSFGTGRHTALHACDLDGDPYGDLIVARVQSDYTPALQALHGSPAGLVAGELFAPPELSGLFYSSLTLLDVVDVDSDGIEEVLLEIESGLRVYELGPAGLVRDPQWYEPGSFTTFFGNSVHARADYDGDGRADLLLSRHHLHRGTAAGFDHAPTWFGDLGFVRPNYQRGWDFDGDGRASVLVRNGSALTVRELSP